ncbi:MAG: ABC transporter substrate-binding protein [Spirochaetaceae bacterium]
MRPNTFLRIGIIILIAVMIPGMLFAAGETEQPATEGMDIDSIDPSGQTITFWHQHSGAREEELLSLIEDFNSTNEWDIEVVASYEGGYGDIYNQMITGIAAGDVPDLVVAYQNQSAAYQVADGLVDLTPFVEHPEYGVSDLDDFFPGILAADVNAQFDNQRLGFPPNRSIEVLYYNRTWLEELGYDDPPSSWDEFAEMVEAATDDEDDTYGYAIRTDASNLYAMAIANGFEIAREDGSGYNFAAPEVAMGPELMRDLLEAGHARLIAERFADQADFGNSRVLFTMGSSSGIPFYASAVEAGAEGPFEWGVAPIPYSTSRPQANLYGASVSVPRTTPERELAAWLFLRWYTEPEQQIRWARASNYFSPRRSVTEGEELDDYIEQNPVYADALDILLTADTNAEPPFSGYDEVRDLMNQAFNAILDGADAMETLEDLEDEANEVHRLSAP